MCINALKADIILYVRWVDPRLQFTPLVQDVPEPVHIGDYRYFWVPELFFYNGQGGAEEIDAAFTITPAGSCVLIKVYTYICILRLILLLF